MANDVAGPGVARDAGALRPLLQYDGRIGEVYRIYLVNLLLTIVTLGIYRFWGVTRLRRYVWAHTRMGGDRFEYDGTGAQLFVSFLLAGLVLVGMGVAAGVLSVLLRQVSRPLSVLPIFGLELAVIVLALGAPFSAQRYRLGHTLWRGIRGGMEGSAIRYGLRSLGYNLLAFLTLYQLLPWAMLRLRERLINASLLGDMRFHARGRPGQLYMVFLATFVAMLAFIAILIGAFFVLDAAGWQAMTHMPRGPGAPADPQTARLARHTMATMIVLYMLFFFGFGLIASAYSAAFMRHLLLHTSAAGGAIQFGSTVRAADIFKLFAGNMLILLFTLGLGYPVVLQRNVRFYADNILTDGVPDAGSLHQTTQRAPTLGEGLFQQLDSGGGFL